MTTTPATMTCEAVRPLLDDLLDGELAAAERAGVLAHLGACAACREEADALRSLLARAAALPSELEPARELWPGIALRLGSPAGQDEPAVLPFERPGATWWARPAFLAAAAAALVTLSSSLTVLVMRREAAPALAGSATGVDATMIPAAAVVADLSQAERSYERAASELMAAVQARRDELQPGTVAALEKNLGAIDTALAEVRLALEKDPGNPGLARLLTSTHKRKVDALWRVVRLARI
ncbi:MAG: zf-HC2 domain-containing protein [Vicinamibacteria bacterium]